MSVSKWAYTPEMCDGGGCPGDCDLCDKPKNMEDEDDMTDYIKREDAINISYPFDDSERNLQDALEDIPSADVVEVVRCKDCRFYNPYDITKAYDCERGLLGVMQDDYCSYGERADT